MLRLLLISSHIKIILKLDRFDLYYQSSMCVCVFVVGIIYATTQINCKPNHFILSTSMCVWVWITMWNILCIIWFRSVKFTQLLILSHSSKKIQINKEDDDVYDPFKICQTVVNMSFTLRKVHKCDSKRNFFCTIVRCWCDVWVSVWLLPIFVFFFISHYFYW